MDYNKQIGELVQHLCANFNHEEMRALIIALAHGISKTLVLIESHDQMHQYLEGILLGISTQACLDHVEFHEKVMNKPPQEKACQHDEDGDVVDYETFLRDFFQPTKTND